MPKTTGKRQDRAGKHRDRCQRHSELIVGGAQMKRKHLLIAIASLVTLFCSASPLFSQNQVLRRIDFSGATKVEKTSGVWIDGEYVGFLKELKGAKKIMLLPGDHEI